MVSVLLLAALALPIVFAAPAPPPMITARASLTDRTPTKVQERDIIDDITGAGNYLTSVLGNLPSYVASGVPEFFQDLPTGTAVASSLGLSDDDLDAIPTQVLNIPGYANWTDEGWNLRFRGNVYKQPSISESKLNDLANVFLIDVDIESLPASQQKQARNLTAGIFVVQQDDEEVSFNVKPAPGKGSDGTITRGGEQNITLPVKTTEQGDFDSFIPLRNVSGAGGYLKPGNGTIDIQRVSVHTDGASLGNATSYLVPVVGLTIISDIDDILRVTKIYQPKEGLLNSFARPFTPWMNMPEIYANWSRSIPDFHFHYLTTTPEQATRNYMEYIYNTYPAGSFDTRPLNFSDVSATLKIRKYLLTRIMQTYPRRKFILVADTSNSDVMSGYPEIAKEFPGQVQCIWLRNTSSTDPENKFPYDTSGFKDLNTNSYMFFNVPNDLKGLDVMNGQCLNTSIPQNVTFGYQGLPFGLGKSAASKFNIGWGNFVMTGLIMVFGAVFGVL